MMIVILGPDGSGKTTIAEILVTKLAEQNVSSRHYAHRFGILPPLSIFFPFRKVGSVSLEKTMLDEESVYDLRQNSALRALIYVSWYGLDYILGGMWHRLKNSLGSKRTVAIFARYFYDYYYQSNNRRLPESIKKLIEILVPKPKFIFFLDRDPQDIHDSKADLPIDEIIKQQQIIITKMSKYPQFKIIDARDGIHKTAEKILEILSILDGR